MFDENLVVINIVSYNCQKFLTCILNVKEISIKWLIVTVTVQCKIVTVFYEWITFEFGDSVLSEVNEFFDSGFEIFFL